MGKRSGGHIKTDNIHIVLKTTSKAVAEGEFHLEIPMSGYQFAIMKLWFSQG